MTAPLVRVCALVPLLILATLMNGWARLGETEAQAAARYGAPAPELVAPTDKPLLPGAREVVYNFSGYRVRSAFVNNVTVRIEYVRLPENGMMRKLTEAEVAAALEAEKGTFTWREEKPRTGNKGLNALQSLVDGRKWERSDHASAKLIAEMLLVLETRDAEALEKRLARQPGTKPTATPSIPKF